MESKWNTTLQQKLSRSKGRAVVKSRGPGISPGYYEYGPRLLLMENKGKLEPKETPRCLIPCLLAVFTQQLEILTTTLKGTSQKVALFFWTECPKQKFVFHFFKANFDTSFRPSRPSSVNGTDLNKMVNAVQGRNLPLLNFAYHLPKQ